MFFLYTSRFGQFISSTLPTFAVCEKFVVMEINNEEKLDSGKWWHGFQAGEEKYFGISSVLTYVKCRNNVISNIVIFYNWLPGNKQ